MRAPTAQIYYTRYKYVCVLQLALTLTLRAECVIALEFCENKNLQGTRGTPGKNKVCN